MATLSERLREAEAAYHDLQIGKAVAEFRDQNGETVRYTQATKSTLLAYITDLRTQLGTARTVSGPMRVYF